MVYNGMWPTLIMVGHFLCFFLITIFANVSTLFRNGTQIKHKFARQILYFNRRLTKLIRTTYVKVLISQQINVQGDDLKPQMTKIKWPGVIVQCTKIP